MSKSESPSFQQNTPSQSPPPPPPPSLKTPASAGSVYEYVMAFDKPLTIEEKTAWLMLIVHYIQSGFLPEQIYPTLCNKIVSLPEVLPAPNRPPEKIPGSDYVHPGPPKPYQVLLKMYEGNKPTCFQENQKVIPYNKENSASPAVLIFTALFIILCLIAYEIGSWRMKSMDDPTEKSTATSNEPASDSVVINEKGLDDPFVASTDLDHEVIRVILEFDDLGNGKLRLAKTAEAAEIFSGRIVDVPSFPNIIFRKNDNGMTNMLVDFNKLDSSYLNRGIPYGIWGDVKHDINKKRFLFPPSESNNLKQILFLSYSTRFPFTLSLDVDDFSGDMFCAKWSPPNEEHWLADCRISSKSGKEGPFTVSLRWKVGPHNNRTSYNILDKSDVDLNKPKEWTFVLPKRNVQFNRDVTLFIGKNLFFDADSQAVGSTVELSRLEFSCMNFLPHIGVDLQEKENYPLIRYVGGKSLAGKAGVEKWDRIISVNGIETDTRVKARDLLYNYELGKPLKMRTKRKDNIEREFVIYE